MVDLDRTTRMSRIIRALGDQLGRSISVIEVIDSEQLIHAIETGRTPINEENMRRITHPVLKDELIRAICLKRVGVKSND